MTKKTTDATSMNKPSAVSGAKVFDGMGDNGFKSDPFMPLGDNIIIPENRPTKTTSTPVDDSEKDEVVYCTGWSGSTLKL